MTMFISRVFKFALLLAPTLLLGCSTGSRTSSPFPPIAHQGYFHVGGAYQTIEKEEVLVGQMYVWYQIPRESKRPYPIVLVHGGGQTGTNFLRTPDVRRGWCRQGRGSGASRRQSNFPIIGRRRRNIPSGPARVARAIRSSTISWR